jgi:hypothetical protein
MTYDKEMELVKPIEEGDGLQPRDHQQDSAPERGWQRSRDQLW